MNNANFVIIWLNNKLTIGPISFNYIIPRSAHVNKLGINIAFPIFYFDSYITSFISRQTNIKTKRVFNVFRTLAASLLNDMTFYFFIFSRHPFSVVQIGRIFCRHFFNHGYECVRSCRSAFCI